MNKTHISSLIVILLSCVLLVAACFYLFPIKNIPLNTTLNAVKLDADGNVIGTEQITIQGSFKEYLFKDRLMELKVTPFDRLKSINIVDRSNPMGFTPFDLDKFYQYTGTAWGN